MTKSNDQPVVYDEKDYPPTFPIDRIIWATDNIGSLLWRRQPVTGQWEIWNYDTVRQWSKSSYCDESMKRAIEKGYVTLHREPPSILFDTSHESNKEQQ